MSSPNPERNLNPEDLLTAASAVTTFNLGLSTYGASHIDTVKGVIAFLIARSSDKLDGWIARLTNKESDAGALYDTVVDKVGIGTAAFNAWKKEVVPRPAIGIVGARNIASVALTGVMTHNHPNESFRPTMAGKIAMGAESAVFIGYALANALENEHPEMIKTRMIAEGVGHAALVTTIVAGSISIGQYAKRAFEKPEVQSE
jgi:phosphatidylglycerophosphate synthase